MEMKQLIVVLLLLDSYGIATHEDKKRLVLHSDLDIASVVEELRHEINAVKQDNIALKTQLTQESLAQKAQTDQEIQALRAEITQLRTGSGSTFVRWGRTVCPHNGTEKVYSGFTAGTKYDTEGGAANYICLPETPSWGYYVDGFQLYGQVYGTEYESGPSAFDQHAFGKSMQDDDAPCAVCHSSRAATIMIPGSTTCYPGWTQEYTGYVMTGHYNYKAASEYICVDRDPEAIFHGEASTNGNLLYFTEVHCGGLPCQVYPQGRELACVVCSK